MDLFYLRKIIKKGGVKWRGKHCDKNKRVSLGDWTIYLYADCKIRRDTM